MSVSAVRDEDKLTLVLTNKDLTYFDEVFKKWDFVSEQAFMRFAISSLLLTEDKVLWIKEYGNLKQIMPADHSVNKDS